MAVKPPRERRLDEVVTATGAGGFLMGNPNAKVRLVEYGSMTCPHCADFDHAAFEPMTTITSRPARSATNSAITSAIRSTLPASLIARCNGPKNFFALTDALYTDQREWVGKLQAAPQAQVEALQNLGPDKQFIEIAKLAGLQKWAAMRGVPTAKSTACLTDQNHGQQARPDEQRHDQPVSGFPGHADIRHQRQDGRLGPVTEAEVWTALEAKLKAALGGEDREQGSAAVRIRRLKLSGFKSFVEPTELRIEPGLTGVVGPNGCGKSNLLEAIRWVMGEGSPKSLRGDGMEDVIFAGTATRPARDFAEVSMLLDRDGR